MVEKIHSEDHEQMLFVQWFRRTFSGVRIFSVPNGGARSPSQAAKMKATGVSAGVPDLYIPAWRLWIEMKRVNGGTVSPEQKDWHEYLRGIGDTVLICKGCEASIKAIDEHIKK